MSRRPHLFALVLFALNGCESPSPLPSTTSKLDAPTETKEASTLPDKRVLQLFGGESGWNPIVEPTRVEAYRVEPLPGLAADEEPPPADDRLALSSYPILSGPADVDPQLAKRIASVLGNADGYGWDYGKACGFDPGVGIRFVGAEAKTDVLICFNCDNIEVVHRGSRIEDTDEMRAALVRLAQEIFPVDREIQELKMTR